MLSRFVCFQESDIMKIVHFTSKIIMQSIFSQRYCAGCGCVSVSGTYYYTGCVYSIIKQYLCRLCDFMCVCVWCLDTLYRLQQASKQPHTKPTCKMRKKSDQTWGFGMLPCDWLVEKYDWTYLTLNSQVCLKNITLKTYSIEWFCVYV